MAAFLRKYATGTGADIIIPVVKAGSDDFAVSADWTPAAGDVKVSKNGGASANIGTLPTFITDIGWKFIFSNAELTSARLNINVVDSATKAIKDQHIVIDTYGNASAQHAIDFDDGVRAGLTALPNAAADVAGGLPISDAGGLDLDAMNTNINDIETDTAEIGTAGAGLTDLGGMSTGMKAEVNAECDTAISDAALATAANLATVDTNVDSILVDTGTTLPATLSTIDGKIDTVDTNVDSILVDTGTTLDNHLTDIKGTGFVKDTDSLTDIRTDVTGINGDAMRGTDSAATAAALSTHDGKLDTVDSNVDTILVDTADMQPKFGTMEDLGNGASIAKNFRDIAGATFATGADSNEAIRDRGDAAWTTGSGTGLSSLATGTAQAGAAGTITLAAGASATNDLFKGTRLLITGGTGNGQARDITAYNGTSKVATIGPVNWITNPDATSAYEIQASNAHVGMWDDTEVSIGATSGLPATDAQAISDDTTAANNLELDYDGTGYAKANSTIGTTTANTDMRGTDSAALASVCTEGRLAELDAANLPSDVDAILVDTSTTLDDHLTDIKGTGFVKDTDSLTDIRTDVTGLNGAAMRGTDSAATASALVTHDGKLDTVDTNVDAVLVDTGEIQGKLPTNNIMGSSVKTDKDDEIDAILVDTGTTLPATLTAMDGKLDIVDTNVDAILVDTADMQPKIGTIEDLGNGTTIAKNMRDIAGATFVTGSDSNEAIRDRGDAAWTTGSGTGLSSLATGTAQAGAASSITLAAGADSNNDTYKGTRILITGGTGIGQARDITAYNGTTKVATTGPVSWITNPDATSTYEIQASNAHVGMWDDTEVVVGAISGLPATDAQAISDDTIAADNAELDYDGTGYAKANSTIGTTTTNTDMRGTDSAATAAALATHDGKLDTVDTNVDAILVDTGTSIPADIAGLNDVSTAEVKTQADAALTDIGLDHMVSASVAGVDVTDNSIIAKIASKSATADWDSFNNTTDSLEAIRDNQSVGGGDWTSGEKEQIRDAIGVDGSKTTATGGQLQIIDTNVDAILVDTSTTLDNHLTDIKGTSFVKDTDSLIDIRTDVTGINGDAMRGTDSAATAAALSTHDGKLDTVDTNVDAVLVDTGITLPASLTTIEGKVDTIDTNVDTILVDTGTTLDNHLTDIKGTGFVKNTDSLTDVRADVTGLNGDAMRGTDSAATAAALATHDGKLDTVDTNVDSVLVDTGTTIPAQISGLNNISASEVNAEVDDVINTDAKSEAASTPGKDASLGDKMNWSFSARKHGLTQDATTQTIYKDDGTALSDATVSDDETTLTVGKFADA